LLKLHQVGPSRDRVIMNAFEVRLIPSPHRFDLGRPPAQPNGQQTHEAGECEPFRAGTARGWVAEAGIDPQFRPHGLRHAGLTRLANAGASPHQIQAWSGHRTLALVSRYTAKADQARLAEQGANILTQNQRSTA
jgi:integrase